MLAQQALALKDSRAVLTGGLAFLATRLVSRAFGTGLPMVPPTSAG